MFVEHYRSCIALLQAAQESKPFTAWLRVQQAAVVSQEHMEQTLQTLIIMPVQRIPRYILLLNEIRNQFCEEVGSGETGETNENSGSNAEETTTTTVQQALADLKRAVQCVSDSCLAVNNHDKAGERAATVAQLSTVLPLTFSLLEPQRKYLFHARVKQVFPKPRDARQRRELWLFNDGLLLVNPDPTKAHNAHNPKAWVLFPELTSWDANLTSSPFVKFMDLSNQADCCIVFESHEGQPGVNAVAAAASTTMSSSAAPLMIGSPEVSQFSAGAKKRCSRKSFTPKAKQSLLARALSYKTMGAMPAVSSEPISSPASSPLQLTAAPAAAAGAAARSAPRTDGMWIVEFDSSAAKASFGAQLAAALEASKRAAAAPRRVSMAPQLQLSSIPQPPSTPVASHARAASAGFASPEPTVADGEHTTKKQRLGFVLSPGGANCPLSPAHVHTPHARSSLIPQTLDAAEKALGGFGMGLFLGPFNKTAAPAAAAAAAATVETTPACFSSPACHRRSLNNSELSPDCEELQAPVFHAYDNRLSLPNRLSMPGGGRSSMPMEPNFHDSPGMEDEEQKDGPPSTAEVQQALEVASAQVAAASRSPAKRTLDEELASAASEMVPSSSVPTTEWSVMGSIEEEESHSQNTSRRTTRMSGHKRSFGETRPEQQTEAEALNVTVKPDQVQLTIAMDDVPQADAEPASSPRALATTTPRATSRVMAETASTTARRKFRVAGGGAASAIKTPRTSRRTNSHPMASVLLASPTMLKPSSLPVSSPVMTPLHRPIAPAGTPQYAAPTIASDQRSKAIASASKSIKEAKEAAAAADVAAAASLHFHGLAAAAPSTSSSAAAAAKTAGHRRTHSVNGSARKQLNLAAAAPVVAVALRPTTAVAAAPVASAVIPSESTMMDLTAPMRLESRAIAQAASARQSLTGGMKGGVTSPLGLSHRANLQSLSGSPLSPAKSGMLQFREALSPSRLQNHQPSASMVLSPGAVDKLAAGNARAVAPTHQRSQTWAGEENL